MEEEAWKLFLEKVGPDILNILGVEPIARSIAKRFVENVPSLSNLQVLKKLDLRGTNIKEFPQGMENLVSLEYLNMDRWKNLHEIPKGILSRLSCLQELIIDETLIRGKKEEPHQYRIFVADAKWHAVFGNTRKLIGVRGCNIYSYQIMLPRDIEELKIHNCNLDCSEGYPLFSRFILFSLATFSSLKFLEIYSCRNMRKLFSPNCVPLNLQELRVNVCEQVEEIIASEGGMVTMEFRLPQLRKLILEDLPELNRICSVGGVLVCDS
ncbi:hypothetical protein V6N13_014289 [Hibiscus sabdariffa]